MMANKPDLVATLVRLTPNQYNWLVRLAQTWQVSQSEALRRLLEAARSSVQIPDSDKKEDREE